MEIYITKMIYMCVSALRVLSTYILRTSIDALDDMLVVCDAKKKLFGYLPKGQIAMPKMTPAVWRHHQSAPCYAKFIHNRLSRSPLDRVALLTA